MPIDNDRKNVKAALEAAHVEIGNALKRVDNANETQLSEMKGGARLLAAFVDFNSGCGKARVSPEELIANLRG